MNNIANNIIKNNTINLNTDEVDIVPCGNRVLIKFYDDNPYRTIETSKSGLIIGMQSTQRYKSNDTGEMEENQEIISCAKVIAVGPVCKDIKVGDDVFVVRYIANPVPFRKMGYYMVDDNNIMCRILKKDQNG